MTYQITPYSIAFLCAMLISTTAAFFAWQRRSAPGGVLLFLMLVAVAQWAVSDVLEASAVEVSVKFFWSAFSYLGAHTTPPLFLLFVFRFTYKDKWITRRNVALLFVIPVITILLAATNEWHHWTWVSVTPSSIGNNMYMYHHGRWFVVSTAYLVLLLVSGSLLLLEFAWHRKEIYRVQSLGMVAAVGTALLGFTIYLLPVNPFPGMDLTLVGLTLTGVIFLILRLRYQLLDVIPVAHEALVEVMADGLIVLDEFNRIVDINPAARTLLGLEKHSVIGQPAADVLSQWVELGKHLQDPGTLAFEFAFDTPQQHYVDARVSDLINRNGVLTGRLILLHDISRRKGIEQALQRANRELQKRLEEIESLQEKLRERAIRDMLTGLFNRRYLEETLERELARAERQNYPVCVILLDIDNFKELNDTRGHIAGDLILHEMGDLLLSSTREEDIACRYGGDEFVLVLTDVDVDTAFQRLEDIRRTFETLRVEYQDDVLTATCSAGLAVFPLDGKTGEQLLQSADQALYSAKAAGRNCVCRYAPA